MKKNNLLICITFVIATFTMIGVSAQTYAPDRPGVALNPYLVGLHQTDYEASVYMLRYVADNELTATVTETNQFRYGMFKHLEIRFGTNLNYCEYPDKSVVKGVRDINIGVKMPLFSGVKYLPDVALFGGVVLPNSGNSSFTPTNYLPSATLLVQKSIGKFTILGNFGVMRDAFTADNWAFVNPNSTDQSLQGTYALATFVSFNKISPFIELYGFYGGGMEPYTAIDLGLAYTLTSRFIIDLSGGISCSQGFDNSFANIGLGWLIPSKTK